MDRTVTVTGQGSAAVVPDAAVLRVAARHRATDVQEAFRGVASAVRVLLDEARAATEPGRVASQGVSLWTTSDQQGRPTGFECSHSVRIRCATLDAAGELLGRLVEAVGDRLQIDGISLEVTDGAAAESAATDAAYADAVTRATALARLAGAALGEPLTIAEGGGHGVQRTRDFPASEASFDSMPIEAGERSVDAAVTVTFALV